MLVIKNLHAKVEGREILRGINLTVAHKTAIDVVDAHRAMIRTADAAKCRAVTSCPSCIHVNELARGFANNLNKLGRGFMIVSRVLTVGTVRREERHTDYQAGQYSDTKHADCRTINKGCDSFCHNSPF